MIKVKLHAGHRIGTLLSWLYVTIYFSVRSVNIGKYFEINLIVCRSLQKIGTYH